MKKKYLIVSTGILAIILMIVSFIVFDNMSWDSESEISSLIAFPAILAGAFGFGSGEASFWTVVVIETLITWGIFLFISFAIIKYIKSSKKP